MFREIALAAFQRGLSLVGTFVALVGLLVAEVGGHCAELGSLVPLVGTLLALVGELVALIGTLIALVGTLVALIGELVAAICLTPAGHVTRMPPFQAHRKGARPARLLCPRGVVESPGEPDSARICRVSALVAMSVHRHGDGWSNSR